MSRILVIDDETHLRENIAEILELNGHDVLKAEDGTQGIQLAHDQHPDLIICDVMMPGLTGYDVLQELHKDPVTGVIPFLFLTANADRASMRQGMQLGADDYLTKPFLPNELLASVKTRLEKRELMSRKFEQQFDELRGSLISVLPHELRTPLNIILGYTDLILEDIESLDRPQIERMIEAIARSGHRLEHVIENYLLYAQTEIQRHDINTMSKQRFEDPGMLIQEVAQSTAQIYKRNGDLTVQTDNVPVGMSGELLRKVIEEIVDNAFKFSAQGTPVAIQARQQKEHYIIQVTDHGRGMAVEQVSRVGAYMQFERKLYEQQGMGLGLILAKRLTELAGGETTIASELRQGTTVTVKLPLE